MTGTKIAGNTFTGEYQGTVGSSIKDKSILVTPIPGYSYVGNVDKDIPDTFVKTPQTANLAYMQLSPIVVHYVDATDPSNVLWTYSLPTNMAARVKSTTQMIANCNLPATPLITIAVIPRVSLIRRLSHTPTSIQSSLITIISPN